MEVNIYKASSAHILDCICVMTISLPIKVKSIKSKAIPVTGREGP
jgi:hypothetical protein